MTKIKSGRRIIRKKSRNCEDDRGYDNVLVDDGRVEILLRGFGSWKRPAEERFGEKIPHLFVSMAVAPLSFPLTAATCRSGCAASEARFFFPMRRRRRWLRSRSPSFVPAVRALREWREYEDAVKEKDLARALRFLKSSETLPLQPLPRSESGSSSSSPSVSYPPDLLAWPEKDWDVLDTCLNADDMRLVGMAYSLLQDRGLLANFGKCKTIGIGLQP